MQRNATCAALAALLLSSAAIGQAIPPPTSDAPMPSADTGSSTSGISAGDAFTRLDDDHDGMVSKKEAKNDKDLVDRWNALDANRDDKLDQAEFAQFETSPSPMRDD